MALINNDRVRETTAVTGTGPATLLGVVAGPFQSFAAGVGNGNTCFYCIADQAGVGDDWEVGFGSYDSGTNALTRTAALRSSNSNALVSFPAGLKDIFVTYPASQAALLDGNGKLNVGGNGYVDWASAAPTVAPGRMWYDAATGAWNMGMGGGNITLQPGEELLVYGKASTAITDSPLKIVYKTGTVGASGTITFANAISGITDGNLIIGVATESIALNSFGRITSYGVVHGVTTDGAAYGETWADNDEIWYNPVTGNPTNIKPVAPNLKVSVGTILNAGSGGSGSIQVEINHGSMLGGTDANVQLTPTPTDLALIQFYATGNYWRDVDVNDVCDPPGTAVAMAIALG
jgi:hypothetical protein